jgi:hypothetical protein
VEGEDEANRDLLVTFASLEEAQALIRVRRNHES